VSALVLRKQGFDSDAFALESIDVSLPVGLPPDETVHIRVKAASLNPVDGKLQRGDFGDAAVGGVLGHDCSGVVVAIGDVAAARTGLSIGDECIAFVEGVGQGWNARGAYSELVQCHFTLVASKPAKLSHEQATASVLVGMTAVRCWNRVKAFVPPGSCVLVTGASGGVGLVITQLALAHGTPVVATCGSKSSADLIRSACPSPDLLTCVVTGRIKSDAVHETFAKVSAEAAGPIAAAFDCVGNAFKELCFFCVAPEGHVVTIFEQPPGTEFLESGAHAAMWDGRKSALFFKNVTLHFEFLGSPTFFGGPTAPTGGGKGHYLTDTLTAALNDLVEALNSGAVRPPPVTVLSTGLDPVALNSGHKDLLEGRSPHGKLVIQFE
jgi:NADPH:quinone reductase-like Zn-dependent oxidoreductase